MTLLVLLVGCMIIQESIGKPMRRHIMSVVPDQRKIPELTWNLDQSIHICPTNGRALKSLSLAHAKRTKTQFHNSGKDTVNLFWYDYQGNPLFKKAIPSNGYFATGTSEGHAFRVWNKDMTIILLDFRVGRKVVGISRGKGAVREEKTLRSIDSGLPPNLLNLDWNDAREVGFVNRLDVDIDLFWVNSKGVERLLVSMAPDTLHYEVTYHMHKFRARLHSDVTSPGKIVQDFLIGDIEIPDCERRKSKTIKMRKKTRREVIEEKKINHNIAWTWASMRNSTFSPRSSM